MLSLAGVDVYYGRVQALRELTMEVGKGEMVALLGANGAGKTTTLRAISGLVPYAAGSITVDGQEVKQRSPSRVVGLGVAHLPQGRELFADLTVRENLRLGHWSRRHEHGKLADRTERVFSLFPKLAQRANQRSGTMSGGEQQMLAVGRALMSDPTLLLVDEASMGLAPMIVGQLFDAIQAVNDAGTSVLVVEQFVEVALQHCTRAYVLAKGSVVLSGPSAELLGSRELLGAYLGDSAASAH